MLQTLKLVARNLPCNLHNGSAVRRIHKCSTLQDKWQLFSAVCLHRSPVISKEKTQIEKDFSALMSQLEFENSSMSDHELRHKEDLLLAEKRKNEDFEETEADAARQTALEEKDLWDEELKTFTFAPRVTEADKSNDEKSLDRLLDRQLTLIVKQKLGSEDSWCLPMGAHIEGESMRQAAERALKEVCGEDINGQFVGNAPVGFIKYKYPPSEQSKGFVGAKVFFFKAWHTAGNATENKSLSDFKWLTKEQIPSVIQQNYVRPLNKFILDL